MLISNWNRSDIPKNIRALTDQLHNKPLQADERRVLVVAKLQVTLAPLAAERQAVSRIESVAIFVVGKLVGLILVRGASIPRHGSGTEAVARKEFVLRRSVFPLCVVSK